MLNINELYINYLLNYYTKEEIGYRLPPEIKLEEFWPQLFHFRQGKGESLPFQDQQGQPFWFASTPELQKNLHEIDSRGKDSLYRSVQRELQTELIQQALIEEALFSSVIEGAFSTLARARELILEGKRPRDTSEQMIKNNAIVMRYVLEQRHLPCSIALMHEIQRRVTESTLQDERGSGHFRESLVYIYNANGEIVYTAPSVESVEPAMQSLIQWINHGEKRPFIHPILCAVIIHTYFVYVHPYVDGNGRTARSLFYWYLLKNGYEFFRYFSISSIIQETRSRYYKALKDMEDYGADMTYVLLYISEAIIRAIDVVLGRILERHRRYLLFSAIRSRQIDLHKRHLTFLKYLARSKDKRITIAKYQRDFRVVYETARRDLALLEQIGILAKCKRSRQFIYTLNPSFLMQGVSSHVKSK